MSVAETFWNAPTRKRFYGVRGKPSVDTMTWHEIRAEAKAMNIDGYTKMKRAELEEAILNGSK